MIKKIFLTFIITALSIPAALSARDYNKGSLPKMANPAWVHPANRKNYQGYQKKRQRLNTGKDWKHTTNRPTGKNRGGGSLYYYDYRSVKQRTSGK